MRKKNNFFFHAMRVVLAAGLMVSFSCKRTEDQAAKQRIFSPEEPVGAAAEAREPLDARQLAEDLGLAQRVLHMPRSEIEARLGRHKALTRVQFAWFRGPGGLPDGGSEVSLAEETTLLQGADGDFDVRLTNDHNQGFELVWVKGEAFVKGLYGPFRKRRTDRTDVARVREQALSALPTFDRLARGLKLKLAGETAVEGRRAVRYAVTGWGARAAEQKDTRDLPPVLYPDPAQGQTGKVWGPDPDTARRLELWEKEEPVSVSGTVVIDVQTGAPLGCDLRGRFRVAPSSEAAPAAELHLHSVLITSAIGKDPGIKAPQWEPDPSVPHAVKDPLRFLAREPATPPGTAEPEEEDKPDEEEKPE
jgi:hypothetical protein